MLCYTDEVVVPGIVNEVNGYLSIVLPMTLISAYLLLKKPRKSIQKKISDPIPEKVE